MKSNMKRLSSYTLIATALLGLAACNRGDGNFDATGTFEATEILVSSEANGKIMELNIEEGGWMPEQWWDISTVPSYI